MDRFSADEAIKERKECFARLKTTREQILKDQASNAKRDAKALKREREWLRKNGGSR